MLRTPSAQCGLSPGDALAEHGIAELRADGDEDDRTDRHDQRGDRRGHIDAEGRDGDGSIDGKRRNGAEAQDTSDEQKAILHGNIPFRNRRSYFRNPEKGLPGLDGCVSPDRPKCRDADECSRFA